MSKNPSDPCAGCIANNFSLTFVGSAILACAVAVGFGIPATHLSSVFLCYINTWYYCCFDPAHEFEDVCL